MMNTKSNTNESSFSDKYFLELINYKDHITSHLEDIDFIEENDCSVLSDFVSALSFDLLQESYDTAEFDS